MLHEVYTGPRSSNIPCAFPSTRKIWFTWIDGNAKLDFRNPEYPTRKAQTSALAQVRVEADAGLAAEHDDSKGLFQPTRRALQFHDLPRQAGRVLLH